MRKSVLAAVLAASSTGLLFTASGPAGEKKPDEQAKEIVRKFFKALLAKDVNASLKLMDVPWVGLFSKDLVKDRKELKKQWAQFLKEAKFDEEPKLEIREVLTFPKFRKKYTKKITEDIGKALDQ